MTFKSIIVAGATMSLCITASAFLWKNPIGRSVGAATNTELTTQPDTSKAACCQKPEAPKACVFKSLMGEEPLGHLKALSNIPAKSQISIDSALAWMSSAQLKDGGWSSNYVQPVAQSKSLNHENYRTEPVTRYDNTANDPSQVSDPASTAMACMALLRCQNTPTQGQYANHLAKGMDFLMKTTEQHAQTPGNNTTISGTQPQRKLGQNIDVVLTAQFFSNVLNYMTPKDPKTSRVKKCLELCVQKIQQNQTENGSTQGSGWAGVLQSSFANNALESAQTQGVQVDQKILDRSREFQKSNFDVKTGNVNTDLGAGVMLYSVSGSSRASAQETRKAKEKIAQAEGILGKDETVSTDNLKKAGLNDSDALRYATAYQVNSAAKVTAQDAKVMDGFGNNGGEEFLSFLQTGEGLVIAKDEDWKNWYDHISTKLITIQNEDGSWNGHHCITSPVFCTATCLLVLSIQHDIAHLQK
jgi:hypothetical protein